MTEYNPRESVKSVVRFLALIAALTLPAFAGDKPPSLQNKLDKIFSAFHSDQPGLAVLVQQNGRTIYQRGFGVRDLESRALITAQTDFRLASCTKQFTAMAVMLYRALPAGESDGDCSL